MKKKTNYLKVIKQIENVRKNNNVNWMNILKIAFKYAPLEASKVMKKINTDDKEISNLFKKLK